MERDQIQPESGYTPDKRINEHRDKNNVLQQLRKDCDSPFSNLPRYASPPNRLVKAKNPFEPALIERLHLNVFSPSAFKIRTPQSCEKFKWTIEQISTLRPAPIDINMSEQIETSTDPETESSAQAKIEEYFSEKHLIPSPWNENEKPEPLLTDLSSSGSPASKVFQNNCTQTVLTLPSVLPEALELALQPYFTFTQDQQYDRNGSLWEKLFHFQSEMSILQSSEEEGELSPIGHSSSIISVKTDKGVMPRTSTTPDTQGSKKKLCHVMPKLDECAISPISKTSPSLSSKSDGSLYHRKSNGTKTVTRLNFSSNMDMDMSFDVPNEELLANGSLDDSLPPESPIRLLEPNTPDTSFDWNMEYKSISINCRSLQKLPENAMDVSNSNTPKSRFCYHQRSVPPSEQDSDDEVLATELEKENADLNLDVSKTSKLTIYNDTGYNTCSVRQSDFTDTGLWDESHGIKSTMTESWNANAIFASTPSKRNYSN